MINLYRLHTHKFPKHTIYWLILSEDVMILTYTTSYWYYTSRNPPIWHITTIDKNLQELRKLL